MNHVSSRCVAGRSLEAIFSVLELTSLFWRFCSSDLSLKGTVVQDTH